MANSTFLLAGKSIKKWPPKVESCLQIYITFQDDENFEDNGVTAIALYDYQAAADDEISFDPNDIITNIEMVSFVSNLNVHYFRYASMCSSCLFLGNWDFLSVCSEMN